MSNPSGPERLSALFSPGEVRCHTPLMDAPSVIRDLVRVVAPRLAISDPDAVAQAVIDRENRYPTALAPGLAIPHVRLEGIPRIGLAIATSALGIPFRDLADQPVLARVVVLILSPQNAPGLSLRALHSLARLFAHPEAPGRLAALKTPEQVWSFFDQDRSALPSFLCAADIMNRNFIALHDSDTLEQAIDQFTEHGVSELPVIDQDGDLVGVVTEDELLHVCLPDYILWMEDLSPIINFQPFAEILRNERKTWLTDIMSSQYAALPMDAPAIQVAKEMARHSLHQVLVLQGKRLVGVIAIQDFIRKVLRE